MSKIWSPAALTLAALIPVATAAGQGCTDGVQLNFCSSTEVSASPGISGRTVVVVTALGASVFAAPTAAELPCFAAARRSLRFMPSLRNNDEGRIEQRWLTLR